MKSIKWRRNGFATMAVAFACAAVLALAGCGGSSPASSGAADAPDAGGEKVLNAGSTGYFYVESMDPANSWDGWLLQYDGVTENLLKLNDSFEAEPWLAEAVENVDELTWKFTLRDNVNFSNGQKMTADAVKACFERTYKQNPRAEETLALDSIEADGQTLTIKTKQAVPSFKNVICDPLFSVYYVGDDVEDYAVATPCTGPYVVEDFVYADHTTLVPNPDYWGEQPKLDRIVLNTFADDDSMILAMQNGELDVLAMPGASAYTTLVDNGDFKKVANASSRADFMRFNMTHPIVAEPAVRTAISYCIDRESYANVINNGTHVPSYGVYSSQLSYGGTEGLNVTVDKFDTEAAAKVLDDAGIVDNDGDGVRELSDGTPVELTASVCSSYERFMNMMDDLQSKLSGIGIKLNIKPADFLLEDAETYAKEDVDISLDSYGMAPTGDADYFASMAFVTGGSANLGGYTNPEVDALVKELEATFDDADREKIVKEFSQKVLDDSAYIFFANSQTSLIMRDGVTGIVASPSEYYFVTAEADIA